MIDTVIFDLDGVIVDSEPVHQENERWMFEQLGLTLTEEEHKNYIGTSAIDMWKQVIAIHDLNKKPEELLEMGRNRYLQMLKKEDRIRLVPGVKTLINHLGKNHFGLLLASSASKKTILTVLNHFDLLDQFEVIIGADDVNRSKPFPDLFLKAAFAHHVQPEDCLVIEDSVNGVKAAKTAGMKCIGYQNSSALLQDLNEGDYVVESLSEINTQLINSLFRYQNPGI